jgi:hypothetical protein
LHNQNENGKPGEGKYAKLGRRGRAGILNKDTFTA